MYQLKLNLVYTTLYFITDCNGYTEITSLYLRDYGDCCLPTEQMFAQI